MFEAIADQPLVKDFLEKLIASEKIPHAFLFSGPKGAGKTLFAKEMAAYLLKAPLSRLDHHPDFHLFLPEGKSAMHPIENLRRLIDLMQMAPFEGVAKVFVIQDAERMLPSSANALLKSLEEPTPLTYFFLLTSSPQELLPTVVSRLSPVRFAAADGKGGAVELLFPLLAGNLNPLDIQLMIKKIEEEVEKEEDPAAQARMVHALFASALFFARDRAKKDVSNPHALIAWERVEKRVQEVKAAYERNISLTACLDFLVKGCN